MRNKVGMLVIIIYTLTLGCGTEVKAIPAFARKYDQSCTLCHVAIPKLNAFGDAFRLNGYRFPKQRQDLVEEEPIHLGGRAQKELWPQQSIWPGEIPGIPPLAIRIKLDYNFNWDNEVKSDFLFPHEVELLSGGNLGEDVSFFLDLAIYEDGGFGGLDRAFLQIDSPIRNSQLFNLKIGQFEPAAVPFSRIRRITMEHYITSSFQNGTNPFSLKDYQQGIELWGILDAAQGGGFYYGAGIVNGSGSGFNDATKSYDNNSAKDVYGRISYKFGGLSLSGESGPTPQNGPWQDNSLRLGSFGYLGRGLESDFFRAGIDLRWQHQDMDLFGTAVYGEDSFSGNSGTKMAFTAYFIEGNYVFWPWILFALRLESVHTPDDENVPDSRNLLTNLSFSIRPNVVMRLELLKDLQTDQDIAGKVRFDFAF